MTIAKQLDPSLRHPHKQQAVCSERGQGSSSKDRGGADVPQRKQPGNWQAARCGARQRLGRNVLPKIAAAQCCVSHVLASTLVT